MDMKKEKLKDRIVSAAFVIIMLMFFLLVSLQVSAQTPHEHIEEEKIEKDGYVKLGLRNGYMSGVSIELEDNKYSIENILKINKRSFNQTVLYKRFAPHATINGLRAFVGMGAHYYHSAEEFDHEAREDNWIRRGPPGIGYDIVGLDFVMGVAYSFAKTPISISFDIKPSMELYATNVANYFFYYRDNAGLTIKYNI